MSVSTKLGLLAAAAVICLALYQWQLVGADPHETTQAALRQFDNNDDAALELRVLDSSRNWRVFGGLAALLVLAAALFAEDIERWLKGHSLET
ncbi:MAG: hypothetical protein HY040_03240 [Planctomycetes bacterium]|nr:hypothetical protein [Planctomycetota bacterium]